MRTFVPAVLASVLLALPGAPVSAVAAPPSALPDVEARTDRGARMISAVALARGADASALVAGPVAAPGATRLAAHAHLEALAGPLIVRWDPVTGSAGIVFARSGWLSPPDSRDAEAVARDFLAEHRDLWLLDEAQVRGLRLKDRVPLGGGAVVWFAQYVEGLRVLHGHVGVAVGADGRVLAAMGGGVSGAGALPASEPTRTPSEAMVALARAAGISLTSLPEPIPGTSTFAMPDVLRAPADVRPAVLPTAWGPRLAWEAVVSPAGTSDVYEIAVDDRLLQVVRRANRAWRVDTRGTVFERSPLQPPRTVVRFPDLFVYRSDLSPRGWAAPDRTEGNNVVARDDRAGDDEATLGVQAQALTGPWLSFDFPYTGDPAVDLEAGLVNLFYGVNLAHDHFFGLGFDEGSGNFQADNLGRGGIGADPVLADGQDGNQVNNAMFIAAPDGFTSHLEVGTDDRSGSLRDLSLDVGVVFHEYTHGVSTRLVGGPADVTCLFGLQGSAMGEGWSDFLAASYLGDPVHGAWGSGNLATGDRAFRLDDNPPAGKDYRSFCTYSSDFQPIFCEPHANGEIWSGFLWILRERFIALHGAEDGRAMIERLVVEAMKLTPCSPSFLDGRDALLLADRFLFDGEHACLITGEAAGRFMGHAAASDGGSDAEPTGDDTPWPECVDAGVVRFTREGLEDGAALPRYGCEDVVTVLVTDATPGGPPPAVVVTASTGDSETLVLGAGAEPSAWTANVPTTRSGVPVAENGTLEVQGLPGETLLASYLDPPRLSPVLAQAEIACAARLRVVRHQLTRSTCDDDTVPGFPELSGFLDVGESADLEITIANDMPVAISGGLVATVDQPFVQVLPSAAVPLNLPAAVGAMRPEATVTLRVVWWDPVFAPPPDPANFFATVSLSLVAPGYDAAAPYLVPVELNHDYTLVAGVTRAVDVETEVAPVGPEWTTGILQPGGNQWTVVTCNPPPTGTRSYRNGPSGSCTANYSDAQGDPWLATPPLDLVVPDLTHDVRLVRGQWRHDIDLGSAGFPIFGVPPALDADAVVVVATNDPTGLDGSEPFALVNEALTFYAHIEIPGIFEVNSNTPGWTAESVDISPLQLSGVDLLQPFEIAWMFLPDVTPSDVPPLPTLDAQGQGYFLDEVVLTYDRVDEADQPQPPCVAAVTPFAYPRLLEPAGGVACAGDLIHLDGELSEAALCPAGILEYRFLAAGGVPATCLEEDGTGMLVPRNEGVDGFGRGFTCWTEARPNTTYELEVRCALDPFPTDKRTFDVRVIDGTVVLSATPGAFCFGSARNVRVDGTASTIVGCREAPLYRFTDSAGAPLDCAGSPGGFTEAATCDLAAAAGDVTVVMDIQCPSVVGCLISGSLVVPLIDLSPVASVVEPQPTCATAPATFTAIGSGGTGCGGGTLEYRFLVASVALPCLGRTQDADGWGSDVECAFAFATDAEAQLEMRCSLDPSCTAVAPLAVDVRDGAAALVSSSSPTDCPGDPLTLLASEATAVQCSGAVEWRFLAGGVVVACDARTQDAEGFGSDPDCLTSHVAGGEDFVAEARCPDDPACRFRSPAQAIAPWSGIPSGRPLGTLRVGKTATCPDTGGDVLLDWSDSGVSPQRFVVVRATDPRNVPGAPRRADVDALSTSDLDVTCDDAGGARWPATPTAVATAVYFYQVLARNACTGEVVADGDVPP